MKLSVNFDVDFNAVELVVRRSIIAFIGNLAPSETLYTSALIEAARSVSGVRDVAFFNRGTNTPLDNQYPATPRAAIRTNSTSINISNSEAV